MSRTPARLPNGTRISDHVTLGVLTATVPGAVIDAVLADTGRQSRRQRQLPARFITSWPWLCTPRRPTARCCAAC
jgi:hypothetical protein